MCIQLTTLPRTNRQIHNSLRHPLRRLRPEYRPSRHPCKRSNEDSNTRRDQRDRAPRPVPDNMASRIDAAAGVLRLVDNAALQGRRRLSDRRDPATRQRGIVQCLEESAEVQFALYAGYAR